MNRPILLAFFNTLLAALMLMPGKAWADSVRGYVLDASDNTPLPFASVAVSLDGSSRQGTTTDVDGFFRLNGIPEGRCRLSVSFVGYVTREFPLELTSDTLLLLKISPDAVDTHKKFPHIVIKKGTTFSSVQK